ncbi:MAG: methylenetetrahydrofolate reductase [NAD(P)H] [Rhodoferax sp.]|nr:methylenetetrahydrofolate reductase [NAD(P)H] [Rhodoferax sp.]
MISVINGPISLEFFPPKSEDGARRLSQVRRELYRLQPTFCSVTYGAGGSTQAGSQDALRDILAEGRPAAAHLTCVGATRERVRQQLAQLRSMGVRQLVALRGDLPAGDASLGEFTHASDLVAFVRAETGDHFRIHVAAYPEVHPQAASPMADLQAFAAKARAGADAAITQYFYQPEAYFSWVEAVRGMGLDLPIVPGVLPITNSTQLLRFSDACGAEIPRWIRLRLLAYGDDLASIRDFGLDVVSALCERLLAGGAPGLHLYTMNQSEAALEIGRRLGLLPPAAPAQALASPQRSGLVSSPLYSVSP